MLATGFSFFPLDYQPSLKNCPPKGGASSIEITTDSKSTVRNNYLFLFVLEYVFVVVGKQDNREVT